MINEWSSWSLNRSYSPLLAPGPSSGGSLCVLSALRTPFSPLFLLCHTRRLILRARAVQWCTGVLQSPVRWPTRLAMKGGTTYRHAGGPAGMKALRYFIFALERGGRAGVLGGRTPWPSQVTRPDAQMVVKKKGWPQRRGAPPMVASGSRSMEYRCAWMYIIGTPGICRRCTKKRRGGWVGSEGVFQAPHPKKLPKHRSIARDRGPPCVSCA